MGAANDARDMEVRDIRGQLAAAGAHMRPMTDTAKITKVLEKIGDPGLVADAILMRPRPEWLRELIGFDLLPPSRGP